MESTPIKARDEATSKMIRINLNEKLNAGQNPDGNSQPCDNNDHQVSPSPNQSGESSGKSGSDLDFSPISPIVPIIKKSPGMARRNLTRSFEEANNQGKSPSQSTYDMGKDRGQKASPKKVRINDPKDSVRIEEYEGIKQVEGVRSQLRDLISGGIPRAVHNKETDASNLNVLAQKEAVDSGSLTSLDTAALLKTFLPYASPPLQMNEEGIMFGSGESVGGKYDKQLLATSNSMLMEIAMLKENVERERFRRKHCEEQIQILQGKVLENEQQLAVAISMDKKKELMIEQLDQTLAKIIDGWKRKEAERNIMFETLQEEKKALERAGRRQQEVLDQFEVELSAAVEALSKEQETAILSREENIKQVKTLEESNTDFQNQLKMQDVTIKELTEEMEKHLTLEEELKKKWREAEDNLLKERDRVRLERQEMESQLDNVQEENDRKLEVLEVDLKQSRNENQELHKQLTGLEHELQIKELDAESFKQEKESMTMELDLMKSQFEALKKKKELEQQEKFEQEFNAKINEIQHEIMQTEEKLREGHRQQIEELNRRHHNEMEEQLNRFRKELNRREEKLLDCQKNWENRYQEAQETTAALEEAKMKLELQRTELLKRLEGLMQQHWAEAVSLIKSDESQIKTVTNQQKDNSVFTDHPSILSSIPFDYSTLKGLVSQGRVPLPTASPNLVPGNQRFAGTSKQRPSSGNQWYDIPVGEPIQSSLSGSISQDKSIDGFASLPRHPMPGQLTDPQTATSLLETDVRQAQLGQILGNALNLKSFNEAEQYTNREDDPRRLFLAGEMDNNRRQYVAKDEQEGHLQRTESGLREHDVDVSDMILENEAKLKETLREQESRQSELSSYIEKLLQKSPGQPVAQDPSFTHLQLQESLDIGSNTRDPTSTQGNLLDALLPRGSNFVSKDNWAAPENYQTPKKTVPQHPNVAFKKSVLKEQPIRSRITTSDPVTVNPKEDLAETDAEKDQMVTLLHALGIHSANPLKSLDDLSTLIEDVKKNVIRTKTGNDPIQITQDTHGKANRSMASKTKSSGRTDVFTRLHKAYGGYETAQKRHPDVLLLKQVAEGHRLTNTQTGKSKGVQHKQGKSLGVHRDLRRSSAKASGRTTIVRK